MIALSIMVTQGYLLDIDSLTSAEVEAIKTKVENNDLTDIELRLLGAKPTHYEGSVEVIK